MKKLVSTALAFCLLASLSACAGGSTSSAASEAASSEATSSEAASSEAASEPAEEASPEGAAAVMSYEEYMAAAVDDPVTIQAYVQAYDMACTQEEYDAMTEGTKIQVSGYKAEWSGEIEIMDGKLDEILTDDTYVAEPVDMTELLGTDELEAHQNEKVSFTGLTVEPSTDAEGNEVAFLYNYDGSGTDGDDLYFNVGYNGATYSFVIESYLCDNTTEVYNAVKNLEVGQTIDCEGFLYWYEGVNPHITSVTVAE